jgi:uncharacterized protein YutE (UPF0331/DUF86 family)
MAGWAGLRNVPAHAYTALDAERIHRALTDERADLVAFARRVEALLEQQD